MQQAIADAWAEDAKRRADHAFRKAREATRHDPETARWADDGGACHGEDE